jgi:hypothetical protein
LTVASIVDNIKQGKRERAFSMICHIRAGSVAMRVKPAVVDFLVDLEDILKADTSVVNMTAGTGEATLCYDTLSQTLNTIIPNMIVCQGHFKDIMTTGPPIAH